MARNRNSEDLLNTIPRKRSVTGEEYLKASDFYISPELDNEDFYPNKDRSINVGSASYKSLGSQPIFVGQGSVYPLAPVAKRQRALDQAAVQAKMYNIAVDEKKKDAAAKAEGSVKYPDSKEVPIAYNSDYNTQGMDIIDKYKQMAESDPAFTNRTDALNDLASDTGKYGSKMRRELVAHKVWGENLNQMAKVSTEIDKHIAAGDFIPDGVRKANEDFTSGKTKDQDALKIAYDATSMGVMNNLLPELNAFSASFDATKDNGYARIKKANVEPSARGFVRKNISGGQKLSLAASLGLAPTATEDELTTALTDQVWRKHSHQQDSSNSGSGADASKNRRFKWDKGVQPQGGTSITTKRLVEGKKGVDQVSVDVTAPNTASSPIVGEGYSFQYLPTSGEGSPNKQWRYSYSIDPQTGEVDGNGGEDSGLLTGVVNAKNEKTGRVEPMAVITKPAHTEKKLVPSQMFPDNRKFDKEETVQVPDKSILIPYDENATEIKNHTVDKHGENGFSLNEDDRNQIKELNGGKGDISEEDQAALNWANANPKDERAKKIFKMLEDKGIQ